MFRPGPTSVGNGLGSRSLASMLASTSGGGLHDSGLAHYTTASPLFDPMPGVSLPSTTPSHHLTSSGLMGGGLQGGGGEHLLDNSNLCDILMLERALETEAAMGGGMSAAREVLAQAGAGENRVDMLEIPGKGRCYVYLARWVVILIRHHHSVWAVSCIFEAVLTTLHQDNGRDTPAREATPSVK